MERSPESTSRVKVSKAVMDGLEVIRSSGVTNMLDLETVLQLAEEWELSETAEWIASADSRTYVHLILYGPEVEDPENPDLREKITELGKRASLVIADSYETEQMGVLAETSIGIMVERERLALIRNLTQASGLLLQLEATVSDVREGVESLESVINPENH